eukprot:gene3299-4131_t
MVEMEEIPYILYEENHQQQQHKDIIIDINNNNTMIQNFIDQKQVQNKTGMFVSAKHLYYYIENKSDQSKQYLLNDISFYLKPGRMVLLMGGPGSGKSLLIKLLADRWGKGKVEGVLLFNNHKIHSSTHQKDVIYVNQEDRHISSLTVRETLDFSAQCNMVDASSIEKKERVDLILDQMGMAHTSNTIVGNEFFRGISGGQKKRVTIASEFTKCPNLILMDEPTTGLDSSISYSIISKVKGIASELKTSTLISLLQPSPELVSLFDDIMIMTEKGNIAYFGPIDQALPYFESIGIVPFKDQPISEFFQEISEDTSKYLKDKGNNLDNNSEKSQAGGQNRLGLIYGTITIQVWTVFGCVEEFYSMRSVYYDQRDGRMYCSFPYFISMTITKFPIAIIEALLLGIPSYWLAGLRPTVDGFIVFILGLVLTNIVSQSIFQCVSSLTSSLLTSILVNPPILYLSIIFAGFMLPEHKIPANELNDHPFSCTEKELIPPNTVANFNHPYPLGFNGVQICPMENGNDFLREFGIPVHYWFRWIDLFIILAFVTVFFVVLFLGIHFCNFETKKPSKTIKVKKTKVKSVPEKVVKSKHTMGKCYMTIKNLTYTVKAKRKNVDTGKMENVTLTLLKNVTAYFRPGLTALMGSSGAGKSTLLDVISGRKNTGNISGEVEINGIPVTKSMNLNRFTGYVEQQDILSENLTVREAIEFSANCRLPSSVSMEEKSKLINEILNLLNIAKIQNLVIDYFHNKLGFPYCPERNTAEFILDISENRDPSKLNLIDTYHRSENFKQTSELIESKFVVPQGLTLPKFKGAYSAPFTTQLYHLICRAWLNQIRRPSTIILRFFRSFIPALVVGTMYFRLGHGQSDARNRLSMLYLSFFFSTMASFGKIPLIVEDRSVFYRESNSSTYPPFLYLISIVITDLPNCFLTAISYYIPVSLLSGLDLGDHGWKLFYGFLTYLLMVMCFESLSMLTAIFFPNVAISTLTLGFIINFLTQFGGFFIPEPSIPRGFIWMHYLMFTKYGFATLGITEMVGQTFNCDDGGSYQIKVGENQTMTYCPIQTGEDMIQSTTPAQVQPTKKKFIFEAPLENHHLQLETSILQLLGNHFKDGEYDIIGNSMIGFIDENFDQKWKEKTGKTFSDWLNVDSKTILLLDETQSIFSIQRKPHEFWAKLKFFISNLNSNLYIVLAAAYGENMDYESDVSTPIQFLPSNRFGLDTMLFKDSEFNELIAKRNQIPKDTGSGFIISDFIKFVLWNSTKGHIGVLTLAIQLLFSKFKINTEDGEVLSFILGGQFMSVLRTNRGFQYDGLTEDEIKYLDQFAHCDQ